MSSESVHLAANTNQALGIAQFAIEFMKSGSPDETVLQRTRMFHTDACLCGLSALALGTNAPTVLRGEALGYPVGDATPKIGEIDQAGSTVFGSTSLVSPEKAILANSSAVREWDSNGTNFGYDPDRGNIAGEFGHNDFYPVAIAAAQMAGKDGAYAVLGMVLSDEIRGRLAEVFSLKTYKVDHVVHGAIASAAVFGAMMGADAEQIESAIGMVVAHAIPFRAIRAGKQLSDSKGASAAISTEFAITAMKRSMNGFMGPRDIFRNPEAIFRIFEGPGQMFVATGKKATNVENADASPFDLHLSMTGTNFTVMGMHFKLGLYEHQSAGALQAMLDLLEKCPSLMDDSSGGNIEKIKIIAYEPAFGIIGDPAKRNPTTRQSADHSMVYIVSTLLRKALSTKSVGWKELMLEPADYGDSAIYDSRTRTLMDKIEFEHGGKDYDDKYPDGIPTSVVITDTDGSAYESGLVMYPGGHARNKTADLNDILAHKFQLLGKLAFEKPEPIIERLNNISNLNADELRSINDFEINTRGSFK